MLGFYCEVYRREPLCRVYVNDVLLDEFNIPHSPYKKIDYPSLFLNPNYNNSDVIKIKNNALFYKFIEFDCSDSNLLDIRIEVINDDNNYNNGFMTKYTKIMLSQFYVIPKGILNALNLLKSRWKFSTDNWYKLHGKTKPVTFFYAGSRNIIENFACSINIHFPGIVQSPVHSNNEQKYHHLPRIWSDDPTKIFIGSSGYFQSNLKKKMGFWQHASDTRKGYRRFNYNVVVKDLYDKYLQYEDQRSSNT